MSKKPKRLFGSQARRLQAANNDGRHAASDTEVTADRPRWTEPDSRPEFPQGKVDFTPHAGVGSGRAGRVAGLRLLRAGRVRELPEYDQLFAEIYRCHFRNRFRMRLDSQLDVLRRSDFDRVVDAFLEPATMWDTMGLRPWSGCVIFDCRWTADGEEYEQAIVVHHASISLYTKVLPCIAHPVPAAAVVKAFNEWNRNKQLRAEAGREPDMPARVVWECKGVPVLDSLFREALTTIRRTAVALARELSVAHKTYEAAVGASAMKVDPDDYDDEWNVWCEPEFVEH